MIFKCAKKEINIFYLGYFFRRKEIMRRAAAPAYGKSGIVGVRAAYRRNRLLFFVLFAAPLGDEIITQVEEHIHFYNTRRFQKKLGQLSPREFREKLAA